MFRKKKNEQTGGVYRIKVDTYGGFEVQAPTKEEVIELYREIVSIPKKPKLSEGIR